MFSCVVRREGHCKKILLASVGNACSGGTTLGLPQPKMVCVSQVYTVEAPRFSERALSQVCPVFHKLPRSKLLRFSGAPQGHRPRWAVPFVPFPGLSSSGDWMLGKHTVSGGLCVLFTSPNLAAQFSRCAASAQSQVFCVSLLGI